MDVSTRRRVVFATVQLVNLLLLGAPLAFVIAVLALPKVPQLAALMDPEPAPSTIYLDDGLVISTVLFFGAVLVGLVFVGTVPRVLNLFITPDKVYPLYGFHYWVHRAIARTTNSKFYMRLFGGTSYVVHYLRWLGYDLHEVRQTGSNFGEVVKHDTPFLSSVGSGTMVADRLSIINADFSSTSFRLSRVSIGAENFLGNRIAYPAQGKTGDNCLLATRVMVPLDGPVREGVGLLGAPASRSRGRSSATSSSNVRSADELRRGLMAKNIHNTITMALFLLIQWILFFAVTVLYLAAVDLWASLGALAFALATAGIFVFSVAYNVLIDRLVRPLMALRPQGCSIYDRAFWRHERFWKLHPTPISGPSTAPRSRTCSGGCWVCGSAARVFDDGVGAARAEFTAIR